MSENVTVSVEVESHNANKGRIDSASKAVSDYEKSVLNLNQTIVGLGAEATKAFEKINAAGVESAANINKSNRDVEMSSGKVANTGREVVKTNREIERSAERAGRANLRFARKAVRAVERYERKVQTARLEVKKFHSDSEASFSAATTSGAVLAQGITDVGRGLALLGVQGEEDLGKVAESVIKVEAFVSLLRGSVTAVIGYSSAVADMAKAYDSLNKAKKASVALDALEAGGSAFASGGKAAKTVSTGSKVATGVNAVSTVANVGAAASNAKNASGANVGAAASNAKNASGAAKSGSSVVKALKFVGVKLLGWGAMLVGAVKAVGAFIASIASFVASAAGAVAAFAVAVGAGIGELFNWVTAGETLTGAIFSWRDSVSKAEEAAARVEKMEKARAERLAKFAKIEEARSKAIAMNTAIEKERNKARNFRIENGVSGGDVAPGGVSDEQANDAKLAAAKNDLSKAVAEFDAAIQPTAERLRAEGGRSAVEQESALEKMQTMLGRVIGLEKERLGVVKSNIAAKKSEIDAINQAIVADKERIQNEKELLKAQSARFADLSKGDQRAVKAAAAKIKSGEDLTRGDKAALKKAGLDRTDSVVTAAAKQGDAAGFGQVTTDLGLDDGVKKAEDQLASDQDRLQKSTQDLNKLEAERVALIKEITAAQEKQLEILIAKNKIEASKTTGVKVDDSGNASVGSEGDDVFGDAVDSQNRLLNGMRSFSATQTGLTEEMIRALADSERNAATARANAR